MSLRDEQGYRSAGTRCLDDLIRIRDDGRDCIVEILALLDCDNRINHLALKCMLQEGCELLHRIHLSSGFQDLLPIHRAYRLLPPSQLPSDLFE